MSISEERKQYLYQYKKEKQHRIPLDVSKEKYAEIKTAADRAGQSVNGYIKQAVNDRLQSEK